MTIPGKTSRDLADAHEQHEQAALRGDDELLPKKRVLGDQLGTRALKC